MQLPLQQKVKANLGSNQHSTFQLCLKCNGNSLQGIPAGYMKVSNSQQGRDLSSKLFQRQRDSDAEELGLQRLTENKLCGEFARPQACQACPAYTSINLPQLYLVYP